MVQPLSRTQSRGVANNGRAHDAVPHQRRNRRARCSFESAIHNHAREAAMGLFSKDIQSFEDLFMHGLQDLYYAENQILKALPDMIEKAPSAELRAGFEKHRKETEGHVHRLRQVFELLDSEPKGDKCPA